MDNYVMKDGNIVRVEDINETVVSPLNCYRLDDTFFEKVPVKYLNNIDSENDTNYANTPIPKRATSGSAGYDFYAPYEVNIEPGESLIVNTYIRCKINKGWLLAMVPKSGLGFKYGISLANTIGIIDSDYYNNPSNGGHIMIKLVNNGNMPIHLNAGDKFCQGIFIPYGVTCDDEPCDSERTGGFGSTGR